jgi:RNA polymerase sigma-70 factor (ECF subfamily)
MPLGGVNSSGMPTPDWEDIVRDHQEPIFRLAYLMLGDAAEAEDVAQETFINAYKTLGRYDPARPIRPWLMRICANVARNRRRSVGRYVRALQRMWVLVNEPDPMSIDERSVKNIDAAALWQAVRRLSSHDQEVIYLRFFLEVPEAEMADVLDVASGTIKSRLHRALGRLRDVVQREFPGLAQEFEA